MHRDFFTIGTKNSILLSPLHNQTSPKSTYFKLLVWCFPWMFEVAVTVYGPPAGIGGSLTNHLQSPVYDSVFFDGFAEMV